MTIDLGTAEIGFKANTGNFMDSFNAVAESMKKLPMLALGVTAGVAALGIAAVKMAGDFQQGMTTLVTGAGESQKNLKLVSDGILQMSVDTGSSTKQLISGMFMIESAGYHGAAGLQVLKNAAEGAKVGNADLGVVADATTTIMKDYNISATNSAQAVNILTATVSSGKTHMQDLAASLSSILPTSSAARVGLTDVMGAMATMTGEGVPAANAATYLRQTIIGLEAPSKGAQKALESVGLSSAQVATEMQRSLPAALQEITDAIGKKFPEGSAQYVEAIKAISGGSKTMQGMLDLTGTHMKEFENNVKGVGDAVTQSGQAIKGWSDVQNDFNFKIDQARQVLETLGIKIGTALLPMLTHLLNDNIIPLMNRFSEWMTRGGGLRDFQQWIQNASAFIQGGLIPAFNNLLNNNIIPLAQWFGSLWQDAVNLFEAFQQGQGYANAVAIALGTIGTAIAAIKVEEFVAGWINMFAAFSTGDGIILNVANSTLPQLGQALGWTKTQAVETSVAVTGIGAASVEAEGVVVASSAAMTIAIGAATLGISLLVGAVIAGIAASTIRGQTAMSAATQQAENSLGQTSADTAAKTKANADVASVSWQTASSDASGRWAIAGAQMAKSSADARAKMVVDQQLIADAAMAAAGRADAAWVQAGNDANLAALYQASGYTASQTARTLGQNVSSSTGTSLSGGGHTNAHAAGGVIAPGTWGTAGEQGTELLYGGSSGISVMDASRTASLGGGGGPIHLHVEVGGVAVQDYIFSQMDARVGARYGAGRRVA